MANLLFSFNYFQGNGKCWGYKERVNFKIWANF